MKPFHRTAAGTVKAKFTVFERELLHDLATQVVALLDDATEPAPDALFAITGIGGGDALSNDPAIARLLPNAYSDDEDAAREFRRLTENSLTSRKIANARALVTSLDGGGKVELAAEAQQAWLRSLTDIRLIVASRLGIEGDDEQGRRETDADLMLRDVYDWLGIVQGSLIDVLE